MSKKFILTSILIVLLLITGCGIEKGTTSEVRGVSMTTEKSVYSGDVAEINAVWTNDTDKDYMFGDRFLTKSW